MKPDILIAGKNRKAGAMFRPTYTITPAILDNLVRTAEAKALIDNAHLIPKWLVALCTSSREVGD